MWIRWGVPLLLFSNTWAQCSFQHAVELHRSGDSEGAIREYRNCLSTPAVRFQAQSNLGAVLAKLGRFEEAITQYQDALGSAPPEVIPQLRFNLALAYYKSSEVPKAATIFEDLLQAQPGNLKLALLLADCRLRTGDFRRAVTVLQPFEPAKSDDAALNYVLGMALIRDGKLSEGQRHVDRILRQGDSAEAHFLLGSAAFSSGNYPGAVDEFSKAAKLNPGLPSLQSYLGRALLFTGDAQGAISALRKALAADPNDYDANFQMSAILAQRGETAESRRLLQRAIEVRPSSAEARDALTNGFQLENAAAGGVPVGTAAPAIGSLDLRHLSKPTVLVFGSYTCPKLRKSAADLKRIAAEFHDRLDFRLVYISEAHAQDATETSWQSTINTREGVDLPPARNLSEKQEHASLCVRKLSLPFATVVDGMDQAAEKAYDAWPSRLYLVSLDGRIAYQTRLGELDFRAADFERAIREMLAKRGPDARSR